MRSWESVTVWSGLSAAVIAVALAALARRRSPDVAVEVEEFPRWSLSGVWLAACLKLSLIFLTTSLGYVTMWPDDGARFEIAHGMKQQLAWNFGDHVWPAGPAILYGLFMRLAEPDVLAVRFLTIAFAVIGIFAAGLLGREISGKALGALPPAFLVAVLPMHTWLSTGAMTEVPFTSMLLTGILLAVLGWRRLKGHRKWGGAFMLLSGISITVATSFRYEAWMFLAVLGPLVVLHYVWFHWGGRFLPSGVAPDRIHHDPDWKRHGLWLLGGCVMSLSFPALWMISSWNALGSPLAFFSSQTSMNTLGTEGPLLERAMLYPRGMHAQMGSLWGLIGGGFLVTMIQRKRHPLAFFLSLLVLSYLGIMLLLCILKGTGVSIERYVISMIVPLFVVAAAVLAPMVEWMKIRESSPSFKVASTAGLLLTGICITGFAGESIRQINGYKHWGYHSESFMVGSFLQQELHEPQLLPGLLQGGRVIIWNPDMRIANHINHLPLMAGDANRVSLHYSSAYPDHASGSGGDTLVIFHQDPETVTRMPDPDFVEIGRFNRAVIYHGEEMIRRSEGE